MSDLKRPQGTFNPKAKGEGDQPLTQKDIIRSLGEWDDAIAKGIMNDYPELLPKH